MSRCDSCGNEYERTFAVEKDGRRFVFDSFECAIHHLAPTCAHCGCRVLGHGIETGPEIYCCAHCARESGAEGAVDRV